MATPRGRYTLLRRCSAWQPLGTSPRLLTGCKSATSPTSHAIPESARTSANPCFRSGVAGERSNLNITVSWSRAFPPDSREPKREVLLRQEAFDVAEVLASRLRSVPELRIDRFFGYVDKASWPAPYGHRLAFRRGLLHFVRSGGGDLRTGGPGRNALLRRGPRVPCQQGRQLQGSPGTTADADRIKDPTDFQILEFDGIPSGAEQTEEA